MANEMIKFLRGNVANLPATATAGAVYFTKDEGLYLGLEDGTYHRYGDFITVADVASLPEIGAHETCMYYCESENVLAKWDGEKWVQINKQKTLAELGGVAKSVYEAKVAALETADANNVTAIAELSAYVGTIPNGEDGQPVAASVVAYVNKKTEGIATDTALSELTGRVSNLETESAKHATKDELNGVDAKFANYKTADAQKAIDDEQDRRLGVIEGDYLKAADIADFETKANVKKVADDLAAYVESNDAALAAETKARTDADAGFETRIAALEGNFGEGEGTVEAQIAAAVAAEKERAEGIEGGLRTDVDAVAGRMTTAEGKITTAEGKIADLEAASATHAVKADVDAAIALKADKSVVDAMYTNEQIDAAIAAEKERAEGVEEGLQNQINTIMSNPDAEGAINSINEFTQYVKDHGTIAEGFRTDIDKNKEDIAANAKAISDKATSDAATYETKADATSKKTEIDGRLDAVEGKVDVEKVSTAISTAVAAEKSRAEGVEAELAGSIATNLQTAKDYADDAVEALGIGDYVKKADADVAYAPAGHNHDDKYDAIGAAAQALTDAKGYADGLAGNYDAVGSAAAAQSAAEAKAAQLDAALKTELQDEIDADVSAAINAEVERANGAYDTKGAASAAQAAAEATAAGALASARTEITAEIDADVKALADGQVATNKTDIATLFAQFQWGSF